MPDIQIKLFPNVTTIIVQLLSTGVLFFVFKKYLWVPVQNYFAKRADYIEGTVNEAKEMNAKAKALMEESDKQARQAAMEYRDIVAQAKEDALKTKTAIQEDANKEYQTQLLNAIKIPLMVYSGRIIQNYPLGLGIRAVIKTNQLVFEAASKSGSDVYNILSTGQLNGLSIALLLSIKNVYGDTKGLDILLIDDPLQTIDDISAISLADLLTQQGIGQIVLSTHEEAKAALLRYKFKHAGMSVREQNMQALYMKTVTEE